MAHWLVKEEPTHYAFADLVREGRTAWAGVHNPLAQRHLRSMRPGDRVFYYHTGSERAVVGMAEVVSEPHPDPQDPRGAFSVDLKPVRPLTRPVSLAEIRDDPRLASMPLVRISRLSVMPVTPAEWKRIEALARTSPA
jgi:predicted RNA-binding protein with PUA-like domain